MMIEVLRASKGTKVQDLGRFGYRSHGISTAGAMDQHASFIANSILGNDPSCAVLECSLYGPKLLFHSHQYIAVFGAECKIKLNGNPLKQGVPVAVRKNDELDIATCVNGNYVYLAVVGGFQSELILGSRSYSPFITQYHELEKGMFLPILEADKIVSSSARIQPKSSEEMMLPVYIGPDYDLLDRETQEKLGKIEFQISKDISRIGFRLKAEQNLQGIEILSGAIQAGTVQLTPAGTCIIMMRDCPVTGGYSRVLQLTDVAINRLSQKIVGSTIKFELSLPS